MRRIFAIDDEKEWLELYVEILADEGYEVTPFTDGRMAIEAMKKGAPDAVILDLRMAPSGRDVLKSIRRTWPTMPVVISSAYGGYHNDPDFDSVESFVEKSTDLLSLRLALESAISKTAGALQPGRSQPPCV
jgi:DNA-binding NtrC family response regulator